MWRQRLHDAKLRLDFARSYLGEVGRDSSSADIPDPVLHAARSKAFRGEHFARAEYKRVLRIYTDLTMNGVIPDETAWLEAQAASASGGSEGDSE